MLAVQQSWVLAAALCITINTSQLPPADHVTLHETPYDFIDSFSLPRFEAA